MCSLFSTALLAASGVAARSRTRPDFKKVTDYINNQPDDDTGHYVVRGPNDGATKTYVSGVVCKAEAWADYFQSQKNAYIHAGETAPVCLATAFSFVPPAAPHRGRACSQARGQELVPAQLRLESVPEDL